MLDLTIPENATIYRVKPQANVLAILLHCSNWCSEHMGDGGQNWGFKMIKDNDFYGFVYWFKDASDAITFKLVFSDLLD